MLPARGRRAFSKGRLLCIRYTSADLSCPAASMTTTAAIDDIFYMSMCKRGATVMVHERNSKEHTCANLSCHAASIRTVAAAIINVCHRSRCSRGRRCMLHCMHNGREDDILE